MFFESFISGKISRIAIECDSWRSCITYLKQESHSMIHLESHGRLPQRFFGRRVLPACVLLPLALLLASCASTGGEQAQYEEKPINHTVTDEDKVAAKSETAITTEGAKLWVNGLGCPLCASNIDRQLKRVRGVKAINVDLSVGVVKLNLIQGRQPSPYTLGEAVEDAGFTLVKIEQTPTHPELLQ
jgi:copper chaperone CopZ